MGAKKKKGGAKKGGGKDLLKKFAESPEEFMIKENVTERIVIDRLTLRLDLLEEENADLVKEFHSKMKDYKNEEAEKLERITNYQEEINKFSKEKQDLKL